VLDGFTPNPARGPLLVSYALTDARPARIDLIDIGGRRILSHAAESGSGRHVVRLAGADEIPPGLYFVRLTQGADRRVRRCAVVR
jgi:hypothetical protein